MSLGTIPAARERSGAQAGSSTQVRPGIRAVALVGPPNCGKSTLYNRLTGTRQKVANYPGVTVEYRVGKLASDSRISLIDLPGIRGRQPHSEDEEVAWKVLQAEIPGVPPPDAVFLILDATRLDFQLPLALEVLALGLPTLVLVNLADALLERGGALHVASLEESLGVPVGLVSATQGTGLERIGQFLKGDGPVKPLKLPPVIQDSSGCRTWARRVAEDSRYRLPKESKWTRRLDSLFLHPFFGPVFLLLATVFVFQSVFSAGQWLGHGIDGGLRRADAAIRPAIPNEMLRSLLMDGLWKGMGSVIVFLPPILLLFLFLGLMEDSGYLGRAAVISDRMMARIGLNGKCFIPLLAGYGCAVPAIMATRVVGSKRDRLATIFVIPFMTCSARLPVYTLLIAAFVPQRMLLGGLIGLRACTLLGLYMLGFLAAVATAKLLNSTVLDNSRMPFVLELPEYRLPRLRSLALILLERAKIFLAQVGTVVLGVSFAIWFLVHLPIRTGQLATMNDSLLSRAGHWLEPLVHPLGFNWKIAVGLLTSFVAREVMVGTLGTIYGADPGATTQNLGAALQRDLTLPGAMALLVFFALAMQCTSTFAVVRRETNSWRWPVLQFVYMGTLAYVCAWIVNLCFGLIL